MSAQIEKIALFIDGANLYATAKSLGFDIDYKRLLRDASCLTHHVAANQTSYEVAGRVRSGIDPLSFRI